MVAMLRLMALLLVDSDFACSCASPSRPMDRTRTATSTSIRPTPFWVCRAAKRACPAWEFRKTDVTSFPRSLSPAPIGERESQGIEQLDSRFRGNDGLIRVFLGVERFMGTIRYRW